MASKKNTTDTPGTATVAKNAMDEIRKQADEIEMRASDIEHLLDAVILTIDSTEDALAAQNAVECFVRNALRNIELLFDHHASIVGLAKAKGGV